MSGIEKLVDTHCHPTDSDNVNLSEHTRKMHAVCAMSTHIEDQDKVRELYKGYPDKVIPYYGYHPWWSHLFTFEENISKEEHYESILLDGKKDDIKREQLSGLLDTLPTPILFQNLLIDIEERLQDNPRAQVGEVGIDRVFRVKGEDGKLTILQPSIEHQKRVAVAQVKLAKKYNRLVSMHSVSATQGSLDIIRAADYQRIVLHSCGIGHNAITAARKEFPDIYFGFSKAINARSMSLLEDSISVTPLNRILTESDFYDEAHFPVQVGEMVDIIARIKDESRDFIVNKVKTNFDELF
ncbi:Metallo-dependent hydrolase [Wallemia mellicola]|nr:Metallo-dependent hydrolase [Wallemia mellicola]TIC11755.1 Metallo-dependent hydrolase [Wallemia mellicola]TIC23492.1 Metallo-dependent hydrolase [Wallemia mellicola]TIC43237.1 Metallo-dependent hydrolase [Wallemia mellicola]TIC73788.1 Metallo-dependent hydrolase [Wallemia mellicola]